MTDKVNKMLFEKCFEDKTKISVNYFKQKNHI